MNKIRIRTIIALSPVTASWDLCHKIDEVYVRVNGVRSVFSLWEQFKQDHKTMINKERNIQ